MGGGRSTGGGGGRGALRSRQPASRDAWILSRREEDRQGALSVGVRWDRQCDFGQVGATTCNHPGGLGPKRAASLLARSSHPSVTNLASELGRAAAASSTATARICWYVRAIVILCSDARMSAVEWRGWFGQGLTREVRRPDINAGVVSPPPSTRQSAQVWRPRHHRY